MPLLVASLALVITATVILIVVLVILIGWIRQDRQLRRMQRDLARRAGVIRAGRKQ